MATCPARMTNMPDRPAALEQQRTIFVAAHLAEPAHPLDFRIRQFRNVCSKRGNAAPESSDCGVPVPIASVWFAAITRISLYSNSQASFRSYRGHQSQIVSRCGIIKRGQAHAHQRSPRSGFVPNSSSRIRASSSGVTIAVPARPRACDLRRFRLSRNADFSRPRVRILHRSCRKRPSCLCCLRLALTAGPDHGRLPSY